MNKTIDFLREHSSPTPSRWREDAQWRRDNEFWLKYARVITLRVLMSMEELCVTQAELAKRLGCTQQYVSNLLKGSSNMTIETIARLENALHIDILQSALTHIDGYNMLSPSRTHHLSDGDEPGYGNKKK